MRASSTLRKHRDLGVSCYCGNTRMMARALTKLYDEALREAGLKSTQLAVLWSVCAIGASSIGAVAKATGLDQSTASRALAELERLGWVRKAAGKDARQRVIELTPSGISKFEEAIPAWTLAQKKAGRLLGEQAIGQFSQTSRRLARKLDAHPALTD